MMGRYFRLDYSSRAESCNKECSGGITRSWSMVIVVVVIVQESVSLVSSYVLLEGHCPSNQWGIRRTSTKYISVSIKY